MEKTGCTSFLANLCGWANAIRNFARANELIGTPVCLTRWAAHVTPIQRDSSAPQWSVRLSLRINGVFPNTRRDGDDAELFFDEVSKLWMQTLIPRRAARNFRLTLRDLVAKLRRDHPVIACPRDERLCLKRHE